LETHIECISRWNVWEGKNGLHEKESIRIPGPSGLLEGNGTEWTSKCLIHKCEKVDPVSK
jgi:hypothetical protein